MRRISAALATKFDVTLVGRHKRTSIAFSPKGYSYRRLNCIFGSGILFYLEFNIRLLIFLIRSNPDIIGSIDLDTLLAGKLAAMILRSEFVFDAHEDFVEVPELQNARIKKWIWNWIGRVCLKHSKNNYTVNRSIASILKRRYACEFEVIRNLPILSSVSRMQGKLSSPVKLIYQGVLNQGRGLEIAIKLVSEQDDLHLTIFGIGDIEDDLKQLASELNCQNRVIFRGFVDPDVLVQETPKFDIGLNLLDPNSGNYYYSSANKAYDYIMAGIPAINMCFPEYEQLNKPCPTSILIDEYTTQALQSGLALLISDDQYYQDLAQNCKSLRSELNWDKESALLFQFYDRFLG